MAEVRISKKEWVRVDGDGLTLRIDGDDAEALADLIYESRADAGAWLDIATSINEAAEEYRKECERAPR